MGKSLPWKRDKDQFKAWREGRTGVPFVDANMREMLQTGWMSNRGRQNVASFLIKDLGLDWRLGAEWFESVLLDHDVCSNYGNWNYAAGIGNDPRENRKFNMVKQGLDYDPDGEYIRAWIPELKELRGSKIHIPWTLSPRELESSGVSLGETYPNPIIIAPEWGRHTGKTKSDGGGSGPGRGTSAANARKSGGGGALRGGGGAGRGGASGGSDRGGGGGNSGVGQRGVDFYFKSSSQSGPPQTFG